LVHDEEYSDPAVYTNHTAEAQN